MKKMFAMPRQTWTAFVLAGFLFGCQKHMTIAPGGDNVVHFGDTIETTSSHCFQVTFPIKQLFDSTFAFYAKGYGGTKQLDSVEITTTINTEFYEGFEVDSSVLAAQNKPYLIDTVNYFEEDALYSEVFLSGEYVQIVTHTPDIFQINATPFFYHFNWQNAVIINYRTSTNMSAFNKNYILFKYLGDLFIGPNSDNIISLGNGQPGSSSQYFTIRYNF